LVRFPSFLLSGVGMIDPHQLPIRIKLPAKCGGLRRLPCIGVDAQKRNRFVDASL